MPQQLTGMEVTLLTGDGDEAGTNSHLYIGVVGSGGGREFPLNSPGENFVAGGTEHFVLGTIWDESTIHPGQTKFPIDSKPGQNNDPARTTLDMDLVNFVYLRKQDSLSTAGDDVYRLRAVNVELYGPSGPSPLPGAGSPKRIFRYTSSQLWLADNYGHVVYLQEFPVG